MACADTTDPEFDFNDLSTYTDSQLADLKNNLTDMQQAATNFAYAVGVAAAISTFFSFGLLAPALGAVAATSYGVGVGAGAIISEIDQEIGNRNPNDPNPNRNGNRWDDCEEDPVEDVAGTFEDPGPSPLVLDLDGDGVELTELSQSNAQFDLNVDGFAESTGWVASDDGLLALDVDNDGKIDDGSELFGDQTGFDHGFLALGAHDENGDGKIDSQDSVYDKLIVWQDLNGDGNSTAEEMMSLEDAGIASISLSANSSNYQIAGNDVLWESTFERADGTTGSIVDAYFSTNNINSDVILPDNFEFHPDVFLLPQLGGMGNLPRSRVAMSEDDALRQDAVDLVTLASSGDITGFMNAFEMFLLAWGGADEVDASSRGPNVDARYLTFFESMFNQQFVQNGDSIPGSNPGQAINEGFDNLAQTLAFEFLQQVAISDALLNTVDEADALSRLENNPLSILAQSGADISAAFPSLASSYGSGDFSFEDVSILLSMFERSSESTASFQADLEAGLASAASGTAGELYAIYLSGAQNTETGTSGDDNLSATTGTIFEGNGGNDAISGSAQADVYIYKLGDGSDTIQEDGSATDRFVFSDLNIDDVTFSQNSGEDLVMTVGSETITVTDHFRNDHEDIEEIIFADGTVLDAAAIRAKSVEDQKDSGYVRGTIHAETYHHAAGDGSYTIQEDGSATDRLVFSDLNIDDVTFSKNSGEDLVMTAGSETITVTDHFRNDHEDIEEIEFADGTVLDASAIRAKSIEDQKASGQVNGTNHAETYHHAAGDGSYTIQEFGNATDRLVFSDLNIDDVTFSKNSGEDLVMTAGSETITVADHFRNDYEDIEEIEFADGTVLDASAIRAKSIEDQKASGQVNGTNHAETYHHAAGDGSYTIQEFGNATDRLVFSDLNIDDVTFSKNSGEDLVMTAGSETITVADHFRNDYEDIEEIEFADGTVLDASAIRAKSIEDQKASGQVNGTNHAETYHHAAGDGSYTIQEFGNATDRLVFSDLNIDDVTFSKNSGEDLVMTAGSETITVADHFRNDYEDIEEIEFADGTVLDASAIRAKSIEDQKASGQVNGTNHAETYHHAAGDGSYTIQEFGSATDHFVFSDLNVDDVTFAQNADEDLVMTAGSETITVADHFRNDYEDIEVITFADGTVLDAAGILDKVAEDYFLL